MKFFSQTGKKTEQSAVRHFDFRLCAFGGLMFWFVVRCHILEENWDFRKRDRWYKIYVCPGEEPTQEMHYNTQGKNLTAVKKALNIRICKLTHATRSSGAQCAQANG